MDITEVRIKLMFSGHEERLLGFCSITFEDAFVVRDLKIIRGGTGPFVAMPSRKLMDRCQSCSFKNPLRAAFCNSCGTALDDDRSYKQPNGKAKLYTDIAHPINSKCRDLIQEDVLAAFEKELIFAQEPGYECRYEDHGENENHSHNGESLIGSSLQRVESGAVRVDRPQTEHAPHSARETVSAIHHGEDHFGEGLF